MCSLVDQRSSFHWRISEEQDDSSYCFITCLERGISNQYPMRSSLSLMCLYLVLLSCSLTFFKMLLTSLRSEIVASLLFFDIWRAVMDKHGIVLLASQILFYLKLSQWFIAIFYPPDVLDILMTVGVVFHRDLDAIIHHLHLKTSKSKSAFFYLRDSKFLSYNVKYPLDEFRCSSYLEVKNVRQDRFMKYSLYILFPCPNHI